VNYMPPDQPMRRSPEQDMRDLAEVREQAEASWRGVNELQIRRKVRDLDRHPFRPMLGRMLATAMRRHAPPMLAHLPPEFLEPTP